MSNLADMRNPHLLLARRPVDVSAVVLTTDGLYTDAGHSWPHTMYGALLSDVLRYAAEMFTGREGVLIVPDRLDVDAQTARGWTLRGLDPESAWTTWHHADMPTVHVGVLPLIDQGKTPLFDVTDQPAVIARQLGAYRQLCGSPWRITPGVSGLVQVRATATQRPLPTWQHPRNGAMSLRGSGQLIWQRDLMTGERRRRYVHQYDINAAYLGAAGVAVLALKPLNRTGPIAYNGWPGYWLIRASDIPVTVGAPPLVEGTQPDGTVWVTGPTMAYMQEFGHNPEVLDSWTSAYPRRVLRPWATMLSNARAACPLSLEPAVKATYGQTIGMFTGGRRSIDRPDWYWTIVDTHRINLIRKITKMAPVIGWPIRCNIDAVWYASDQPDPEKAFPAKLTTGPASRRPVGQWRHAGTLPTTEYLESVHHAHR